jgi:hypothetical protein
MVFDPRFPSLSLSLIACCLLTPALPNAIAYIIKQSPLLAIQLYRLFCGPILSIKSTPLAGEFFIPRRFEQQCCRHLLLSSH